MKKYQTVFCFTFLFVRVGLAQSAVQFQSTDQNIQSAFSWAKAMALSYQSTGHDPVGPWYESALPPRDAFCMRDVSHQCIGAEILGMHLENKNMFTKFAGNISSSKDWCSYWEIDKFGRPSPSDYKSDREFWYNLNANFDFMDACWRSYLWTGDSLYIQNPVFRNFYDKTVHEYIVKWVLQPDSLLIRPAHPNAPFPFDVRESFDRCRGLPSYSEGIQNLKMGVDLVAALYRGMMTYAAMSSLKGDKDSADLYLKKADAYRLHLEKYWWDEKASLYNTYYTPDDHFGKGEGETFLLWFDALKDSSRKKLTIEHILSMDLNVENLSYLPLLYYRHGYSTEARSLILHLADPNTERRQYPEVSYGLVEAIVQGLMGVEADATTNTITTIDRGHAMDTSKLSDLPVLHSKITISYFGQQASAIINQGNFPFQWKACFNGKFSGIYNGKKWLPLRYENDKSGKPVSYLISTVKAGEEIVLQLKK
jgi:Trehalase